MAQGTSHLAEVLVHHETYVDLIKLTSYVHTFILRGETIIVSIIIVAIIERKVHSSTMILEQRTPEVETIQM